MHRRSRQEVVYGTEPSADSLVKLEADEVVDPGIRVEAIVRVIRHWKQCEGLALPARELLVARRIAERVDVICQAGHIGGIEAVEPEVWVACGVDLIDQPSELAAAEAHDLVVNQWRAESELARLNAAGGGAASPELLAALAAVRRAQAQTRGRFDPTVGPLIRLWQAAAEADRLPDADALAQARAALGFDRVRIDGARVTLPTGGALDLGGIAKGLVLDAAAAAMGERRALLTHGGSSHRATGPADGAPFPVALRDPRDAQRVLQTVPLPPGRGLGSACSDGRVFRVQGQAFSHLIDPIAGAPGAPGRAAWVLAGDAATADGLDTALCLLPVADALAAARDAGVEALLWVDGALHATPGWPGR